MITMVSEDEGVPMEIWAKGDNLRAEASDGERKVITIQRGDTSYTFAPDSTKGHKMRVEEGLGSMGLVKQIAEIKAKGKREGAQELEGVVYDKYNYDVDAPQEWAVVFLDAKTSLPRYWISAVRTGEKTASAVRMVYRDMEANVEVADALFELPENVTFEEQPALPVQEPAAEQPAEVPNPPIPAE
jgi:outer membrane lipoprotein-sorting protein